MNNLTITEEMLSDLPEPVKRYIRYSGVVGSSWIESVRLTQVGKFRQSAEQPWMRFSAEQSYTTKPAGYRWNATFKMAGIPLLKAEDKYEEGHGRMYGKLAGLKTIFDEEGEQIDQASMLRYLNEMMWFPTAFLQDNVSWEELDDKNAKVKFSDAGREGEAQMHFDPEGRLKNFTAMRYRENSGEYSLDRWSTPITAYGEYAGLKLPRKGSAIWHHPDGDLTYIALEIKKIEYKLGT